jgi:hypothetical protein
MPGFAARQITDQELRAALHLDQPATLDQGQA